MANQLTISGAPLQQGAEAVQIGPLIVTSTITAIFGTISSVGASNYTITIPAAAAGIVIYPPTANTATLTIKGLVADQGYPIPKASPYFTMFDTTSAGFNIVLTTSAAAGTINYVIF